MLPPRPGTPDPRLSDAQAAELLARASQLDARRQASTSITELRAAATEAGIALQAFDTAVGELHSARPASRLPRWAIALAVAVVILAGAAARSWFISAPAPATTEQAFLLRCLPAIDAADLVRPLVRDAWSTVVIDPTHSPRILTVRTTPGQLERIREILNAHDGAGSACPAALPARSL